LERPERPRTKTMHRAKTQRRKEGLKPSVVSYAERAKSKSVSRDRK
jgi:hypothetical protein